MKVISFPHAPMNHGGPGSFQSRIEKELIEKGYTVQYAGHESHKPDVILIVNGTKKVLWLLVNKLKGVRIVHRLDGINWEYKSIRLRMMVRLRIILLNRLIWFIRNFLADEIIYQSEYVKSLWYGTYGKVSKQEHVIYNAVDLDLFKPKQDSDSAPKLICVEGALSFPADAYTAPLRTLSSYLKKQGKTIDVYGKFSEAFKNLFDTINWKGSVPRSLMSEIFQNSVYLVLEVNPSCPNSVIESLASGSPVLGFSTGSMSELINKESGILLDYGNDPWKLEAPDCTDLCAAYDRIILNYKEYSSGARQRAESCFDVKVMCSNYIRVLDPECIETEDSN